MDSRLPGITVLDEVAPSIIFLFGLFHAEFAMSGI